ncbi:PREDICTED: uncharacterized protein LOC105557495 [Vollenhovia emeryi]|uniref:uncharacterized protein LOC105557495 n=1 Tax=Vollenhovia emeryi TaxID=411798 RepID=UPI0005F3E20A|nr:PREDICTED: uncharacterized protein LOC105557495 [Vollenhovia emeryi]
MRLSSDESRDITNQAIGQLDTRYRACTSSEIASSSERSGIIGEWTTLSGFKWDSTRIQPENAPASNSTNPTQRSQTEEAEATPLTNQAASTDKNSEDIFDLDEETLKIIGEEPSKALKELEIHSSLVNRWNPWLKQGLKREARDELLKKYPRAGPCSLEPPILNQELSSLNTNILKKDKYFTFTQNLAGAALSTLVPVIIDLVPMKSKESKRRLENLWDAAQLLAEIHHSQTIARRACILPSVSKQMADQLMKREADKYLFGENLGERIKEIKMINKLGQDMKIQPKTTPNLQSSSNWKGPLVSLKSPTQSGPKYRPEQSRRPAASESTRKSYPKSSSYRDRARYRDKSRHR